MAKTTATLTIRNVPSRVVKGLKALARRRDQSMEQAVRELLAAQIEDRASVLRQIEASWANQARRPSAAEIDGWIANGRE
jgi:plasmid stability protein